MKLRQKPEDFIVTEVNDLKIDNEKGAYRIYLVEKRGIESFQLLSHLSKKSNLPISEIGISGLKDKHAITRQYLTMPGKSRLINTFDEPNLKMEFLGFVDRPLKPGELHGNVFEIVVRDLKANEARRAIQEAKKVFELGVPNYFDSQRFGSLVNGEFIGKRIVLKDYESAVKAYLTGYSKSENRKVKEEKREIARNWPSFSGLKLENRRLANIIQMYIKSKSWLQAYLSIPENLREMFISAYQSYLWNECIKELVHARIGNEYLYPVKYAAGKLLFLKQEPDIKFPAKFKTVSNEMIYEPSERLIIEGILKKEGLSLDEFDIKKETGNYFRTYDRDFFVRPEKAIIGEPERDELNSIASHERFKLKLRFFLSKGSYATVVTKAIFRQ